MRGLALGWGTSPSPLRVAVCVRRVSQAPFHRRLPGYTLNNDRDREDAREEMCVSVRASPATHPAPGGSFPSPGN